MLMIQMDLIGNQLVIYRQSDIKRVPPLKRDNDDDIGKTAKIKEFHNGAKIELDQARSQKKPR